MAINDGNTGAESTPPMNGRNNRVKKVPSVVTFQDVVVNDMANVDPIHEEPFSGGVEHMQPDHSGAENANSISPVKHPIVRIATEARLRTITHKVKRPAVDIEFHDLIYTAKTGSGKSWTSLLSIINADEYDIFDIDWDRFKYNEKLTNQNGQFGGDGEFRKIGSIFCWKFGHSIFRTSVN